MKAYFPSSTARLDHAAQTGNWLLETGRAITVTSRGGGQLLVASGRVWATLGSGSRQAWSAAPLAPCATLKDYFLSAGDILTVPSGARVVIESMGRAHSLPVAFAWAQTAPVMRQERHERQALQERPERPERVAVVQAAGELGRALGQVLLAVRRLVAAVVLGPKPAERLETCL